VAGSRDDSDNWVASTGHGNPNGPATIYSTCSAGDIEEAQVNQSGRPASRRLSTYSSSLGK